MDERSSEIEQITVDAYGDEGYWSFCQAFEDHLAFPAPASVVGADVAVTDVDFDGDERRGLRPCAATRRVKPQNYYGPASGCPPDNLVFTTSASTPIDPSNLRRALARATRAAELGHWTPYELRHSCASLLSAAGVPLEQIADIPGHKGIRMTAEVYRHRLDPVIESGVKPMEELFGDGTV